MTQFNFNSKFNHHVYWGLLYNKHSARHWRHMNRSKTQNQPAFRKNPLGKVRSTYETMHNTGRHGLRAKGIQMWERAARFDLGDQRRICAPGRTFSGPYRILSYTHTTPAKLSCPSHHHLLTKLGSRSPNLFHFTGLCLWTQQPFHFHCEVSPCNFWALCGQVIKSLWASVYSPIKW